MRRSILLIAFLTLLSPSVCFAESGVASWYSSADACGPKTNNHKGCPTASGKGLYDLERMGKLFAASNKHKIGTTLKVCNKSNGRCVEVEVLDRGGFKKYGRSLDLCKKAFGIIAPTRQGLVEVTITKI
jgi:rare lipoprotein A